MERVNCNLCGSSRKKLWKMMGSWRIVRCRDCGFAFLNPRPTPEELKKFVTEESLNRMYGGALERKDTDASPVADRLTMLSRFKKGGSVLDVGCGEGSFLAAARDLGWSVSGIEVLEGPAELAKQRIGNVVMIGDVLDVDLRESSYDAITLWDSLEHMHDPTAAVQRLKSLLKPDGVLIVRVPNCASFDSIIYNRRWHPWWVPFHMSHFTPRTLRRLLEKNGFRVEAVETKISSLIWSLRNALRLRPKKTDRNASAAPTRSLMAAAPREGRLFRMLKKVFTGREVTAVARPE